MTRGAQVGGVLPALVGLFDLRGWPRSSWGQASFKLALLRVTCGCHLFPLVWMGRDVSCSRSLWEGPSSGIALGVSAAVVTVTVTVTVDSSRMSQRQALAFPRAATRVT